MLAKLKIDDFLLELASDSPAPGGGSVSAILGGLSSALCSMMASLTIGKKGYEDVSEESQKIVEKMNAHINKFNNLIDRDATSFDDVIASFKLPKATDEEKEIRRQAIQKGYKTAIQVPLEICENLVSLFDNIEYIVAKGNKNVITDGVAAAMCCKTGVRVALLNVKINMKSIKDEDYVKELEEKICHFEKVVTEREQQILELSGF